LPGSTPTGLVEGKEFDLHQWVNETLGSPNTKRDRHCRGDACEQMAANDFNDLASLALAQFDDWIEAGFTRGQARKLCHTAGATQAGGGDFLKRWHDEIGLLLKDMPAGGGDTVEGGSAKSPGRSGSVIARPPDSPKPERRASFTEQRAVVPAMEAPAAPSGEKIHVVFSYSTKEDEFMKILRQRLNSSGIMTADGSQVPTGCHWREWYFEKLGQACILVYILSRNALTSEYCCDELFFARDNNLAIVPALYKLDQIETLEQEIRDGQHPIFAKKYPAIKSVLNRCNRLPQNGSFDDDLEGNVRRLLVRVSDELSARGVTPGLSYDWDAEYSPQDYVRLLREGNQSTQYQAMEQLGEIAKIEELRDEAVAAGAFSCLLGLSEGKNATTRSLALRAMFRLACIDDEYVRTIIPDRPMQSRYFGTFHAYFAKKGLMAKLLYGFEFYFNLDDVEFSADGADLTGEMVSTMLEMQLVQTDDEAAVGSHFDGGVLLTEEDFEKRTSNFKNKRRNQLRMGFPVSGVFNLHQRLVTLQGHPEKDNAANLKPCSYQIVLSEDGMGIMGTVAVVEHDHRQAFAAIRGNAV